MRRRNPTRIPGVNNWTMFAGGTSAASGKHSYEFRADGQTYSIWPISSQYGRHQGYKLTTYPGVPAHGHQQIGGMHRSPAAAAKVAREWAAKNVEVATNPTFSTRKAAKIYQRIVGGKRKGRTVTNPTRYGTSYFASRGAAIRYYKDYGDDAASVDRKIREGSIHIGRPPLKPGATVRLIDRGTRYEVTENPASRLNPNRLTPVAFTVKGKRHTGKAKLVGGKVKIFVTPEVARKVNPKAGTITYTHRGEVERGADYHWVPGYSETGPKGEVYYPCMTKRECQADAKKRGLKAVFKER